VQRSDLPKADPGADPYKMAVASDLGAVGQNVQLIATLYNARKERERAAMNYAVNGLCACLIAASIGGCQSAAPVAVTAPAPQAQMPEPAMAAPPPPPPKPAKWEVIEPDNGALSAIDMNSVERLGNDKAFAGATFAKVCSAESCAPWDSIQTLFDCQGSYRRGDIERIPDTVDARAAPIGDRSHGRACLCRSRSGRAAGRKAGLEAAVRR
jgi:hypothetical protein